MRENVRNFSSTDSWPSFSSMSEPIVETPQTTENKPTEQPAAVSTPKAKPEPPKKDKKEEKKKEEKPKEEKKKGPSHEDLIKAATNFPVPDVYACRIGLFFLIFLLIL